MNLHEPEKYKTNLDIELNEIYKHYQQWKFCNGEWCYMGYDRIFGWIRLGKTKEEAEQYVTEDYKHRKDHYVELIKKGVIFL